MHFLYANLTVTCYLELRNRGKLLEGYLKRYCLQKSIMYSNIVFMQTCLCVTCYLDLGNRGKLLEGYLKRYCLQKSIMYSNIFYNVSRGQAPEREVVLT